MVKKLSNRDKQRNKIIKLEHDAMALRKSFLNSEGLLLDEEVKLLDESLAALTKLCETVLKWNRR